MTIFWLSNIINVFGLLIMAWAGWLIFSGVYSFFELNIGIFITQVVPWFQWMEAVIFAPLGDFGRWILSIPVLVHSPIKFIAGVFISWWAYSTAKNMSSEPAST
jgi:hypothetical protein